jgi:hypothetical protein
LPSCVGANAFRKAWTKRSKKSGEFMAIRKLAKKKKAAKKIKGVRVEKKAGKKKKARAVGRG